MSNGNGPGVSVVENIKTHANIIGARECAHTHTDPVIFQQIIVILLTWLPFRHPVSDRGAHATM